MNKQMRLSNHIILRGIHAQEIGQALAAFNNGIIGCHENIMIYVERGPLPVWLRIGSPERGFARAKERQYACPMDVGFTLVFSVFVVAVIEFLLQPGEA